MPGRVNKSGNVKKDLPSRSQKSKNAAATKITRSIKYVIFNRQPAAFLLHFDRCLQLYFLESFVPDGVIYEN